MKMSSILQTVAAASAAGALLATSAFAQMQMTYAHSENPNSVMAAEAFKALVEGQSAGEIEVNLVIHSTLGGDRDVVDQMRLGELEFYVVGIHGLSGIAPNLQMFDAPYLFANRNEFYNLMRDEELVEYLRDHILDRSNNTIRFLGAAENSVRNLYSSHGPIRLPSDLGPVKLRVPPGPLNIAVWQELGVGSVVGLSGAERNQGLQTGIIDATEGSLSGTVAGGRLVGHITMTGHSFSYMAYIINEDFWQSLGDDQRDIITAATELSIIIQNGAAMTAELDALEQARVEGEVVTILSPAEAAVWQETAFPVGQEFVAENLDADFAERVQDAIDAMRAR